MGLLDDAIREHLELKRKHGAPDEELTRQETEALGPARRDFATREAVQEEPAAPLPADDAAAAYEPEPPAEPAGWLDDDEEPTRPATPVQRTVEPPPPPEPEPEPEPEPVERAPEPVAEVPPEPAAPPRRKSDTPTQGFDALSLDEEEGESEVPAGENEDVLEETPDFLQDTPEHDRLWFEQKPPRDFDFDD